MNNSSIDTTHRTLLLVEDDAIIALAQRATLERSGYSVVTAQDGTTAIETARCRPEIDLILMDINLGEGIDGTEAAELILAERDLPVVFLSSHTAPEVVQKTEGITSYGYIVKNSGETVLLASIRMAFRLFEARRSEREAMEREEALAGRYAALLHAIPDLMFVLNRDGVYVDYLANHGRELYLPPDQFMGKAMREVLPPDLADTSHRILQRAFDTGTVQRYTYELETNGERRFYENRMIPCSEHEALSIIRNITEQETAQATLSRNERYLTSILSTTADGFWTVDADGFISDANDAYCRMSGYDREELIGRPVWEIDATEEAEDTTCRIARIREARAATFETLHRRKDGSLFDVEVSASWLGDEYQALVAFCRDISERKRHQEELKTQQARWQFALESAEQGLWDWDAQTNRVFFSHQWKRMLGYEDHEVGDTLNEWDSRLHPDDRDAAYRELRRHFDSETSVYVSEHRLRCKDGSYRWILDRGKVIGRTVDGAPLRVIGTHTDITERKQSELEIERLLREKDLLLRETNHRVKNNIAVIRSLLSLEADTLTDPAGVVALQRAIGCVQSMEVLYDRIHRASGDQYLNLADYLKPLILDIVSLFRHTHAVDLNLDLEPVTLPVARVSPLGIIVNELITNSIKHAFDESREGSIHVGLSQRDGSATLSYQDSGPGFNAAAGRDEPHPREEGFGLSLIGSLAEQIGGRLERHHESGRFTIHFPAD